MIRVLLGRRDGEGPLEVELDFQEPYNWLREYPLRSVSACSNRSTSCARVRQEVPLASTWSSRSWSGMTDASRYSVSPEGARSCGLNFHRADAQTSPCSRNVDLLSSGCPVRDVTKDRSCGGNAHTQGPQTDTPATARLSIRPPDADGRSGALGVNSRSRVPQGWSSFYGARYVQS